MTNFMLYTTNFVIVWVSSIKIRIFLSEYFPTIIIGILIFVYEYIQNNSSFLSTMYNSIHPCFRLYCTHPYIPPLQSNIAHMHPFTPPDHPDGDGFLARNRYHLRVWARAINIHERAHARVRACARNNDCCHTAIRNADSPISDLRACNMRFFKCYTAENPENRIQAF